MGRGRVNPARLAGARAAANPAPGIGPAGGVTLTFYSAASSGAAATTLNTVTVIDGIVTAWAQSVPSGEAPGQWWFDDPVNSQQVLTVGF